MKLYNHPERGIVYNPNWPVEPIQEDFVESIAVGELFHVDDYTSSVNTYNSALQTAIGEAIPFEDQKEGYTVIRDNNIQKNQSLFELKPATFYEVPDMKLELLRKCFGSGFGSCAPNDKGCFCKESPTVYRIVSEPKQEPEPINGEGIIENVLDRLDTLYLTDFNKGLITKDELQTATRILITQLFNHKQESKVETQEELWNIVIDKCVLLDSRESRIKWFTENFNPLTRKQS